MSGSLVIVSTPIGNLGDLSPRARESLERADVICCEDTRRTRVLLSAVGIAAAGRLVSLHAHNEASRTEWVASRIESGAVVVYVSDAGTPCVSDPGDRLVAGLLDRGLTVTAVPGPSAVLAALVVSGIPSDRFCVEGFLPRRGAERARRLEVLRDEARTAVLFEAPARVAATLAALAAVCGDRPAAVCRELTKLHEEVRRGSLSALAASMATEPAPRGEVVIVIGGATPTEAGDDDLELAIADALEGGATVRDAATAVAGSLGVSRRRAYDAALRHRPEANG